MSRSKHRTIALDYFSSDRGGMIGLGDSTVGRQYSYLGRTISPTLHLKSLIVRVELETTSSDGVMTDSLLEKTPEEKESLPIASRTIRLEGDVDRALEEIAKQENQSISLIMNKALLRYVDWEYPAGRFGVITVSTSVMRKLFELSTIDQARAFGKEAGAQFLSEFINFRFKALDFNALLKALDFLGDRYAREFHFDQSSDGKVHTIIIKHDRGSATSAYYAEALKALLDRLDLKVETVESDQQVTITVHG